MGPRNSIRFVNGEFTVDITGSNMDQNTKSKARELYEKWLKNIAYQILVRRTEINAQKLGVNVQKISVKSSLKSRWGSLTRKGSINLICISSKLQRIS
jgi:predicted metal-dependent hydrolase